MHAFIHVKGESGVCVVQGTFNIWLNYRCNIRNDSANGLWEKVRKVKKALTECPKWQCTCTSHIIYIYRNISQQLSYFFMCSLSLFRWCHSFALYVWVAVLRFLLFYTIFFSMRLSVSVYFRSSDQDVCGVIIIN